MFRRDFLLGTGALCLASQVKAFAQTAEPLRARVYADKAPTSLVSYKKAVEAMLALDANDGRNWFRQALIHIVDCPHRNWWFLPWHRGYLANFENICRELSGDDAFRLPYWDWTAGPSVPKAFFDAELNPADDRFREGYNKFRSGAEPVLTKWWSGLSADQRGQLEKRGMGDVGSVLGTMDGAFESSNGARDLTADDSDLPDYVKAVVKIAFIEKALKPKSFASFASGKAADHHQKSSSGPLEGGPHDNVHGGTGGFMGAFLSPVDPLFWLHHANLDRLWDVWSRKQAKAGLPTLPDKPAEADALKNEPLLFFHARDGAVLAKTCGDYIDLQSLGYSYESGSGEEFVGAPVPPPLTLAGPFLAENIGKDLRNGFETSVAIPGLKDALETVSGNDSNELYARITLAPPEDPKGVNLRVYINCPYLSKYTPVEDPHYVGTINFFSALHHHGHHSNDFEVLMPLGVALDALDKAGKLPSSAIKVQLITDAGEEMQAADGMLKSVAIEAD